MGGKVSTPNTMQTLGLGQASPARQQRCGLEGQHGGFPLVGALTSSTVGGQNKDHMAPTNWRKHSGGEFRGAVLLSEDDLGITNPCKGDQNMTHKN